ncbi:MAG: hypothetical protein CFE44_13885 [Burkholderiales bacterium PBB4]|nr:MAG: hypothetical protein CFE44_13885 [Burkholderiales bacterium PBB4]
MTGLLINFASALGTFFAALVALHLGLDAQRRSLRIDDARASIAAARLISRVERIGLRLDWTIQAVLYKGDNNGRFRYLLMGIRGNDLSDESLEFSDEELLGLTPLGNKCPITIALCTTEIVRIRRSIEFYEEIFKDLRSGKEKDDLVEQWMASLQAVSSDLRSSYLTLNSAVANTKLGDRPVAA